MKLHTTTLSTIDKNRKVQSVPTGQCLIKNKRLHCHTKTVYMNYIHLCRIIRHAIYHGGSIGHMKNVLVGGLTI